jgi:hypothetical protein
MVVAAQSNGHQVTGKPKLTRAESNRRNSQKSTGPRTEAGKARSKYNALKHGMRAESVLLPGEDAGEYEATREQFQEEMSPRNGVEAHFVDSIVDDAWSLLRTKRAAAAQLAYTLRNQPIEQARAERENVIECSRRLVRDLTDPDPFTPDDRNGGPGHPGRLVEALEATVAGCDWLLGRFRQLKMHLNAHDVWRQRDGYELLRLLGFHAGEVSSEDSVAVLLLASQSVIDESGPDASTDRDTVDEGDDDPEDGGDESELGTKSWDEVVDSLDRKTQLVIRAMEPIESLAEGLIDPRLKALAPSNVTAARRQIADVLEKATARLLELRALRAQIAEANAAEAPARLAIDRTHQGYLERRYVLAHRRALIATVNEFYKIRNAANDGTLAQVEFDPTDRSDRTDPTDRSLTDPPSHTSPFGCAQGSPPRPAVSPSNRQQGSHGDACPEKAARIPAFLEAIVTESFGAGDGCEDAPILPNEAKLPCPGENAEPCPEPERGRSSAPDAAAIPSSPSPSQPCTPDQRRGPTQSEQRTADHGSRSSPRGGPRSPTAATHPPRPQEYRQRIREPWAEATRDDVDTQRVPHAIPGVSTVQEYGRRYNKPPPRG